MGVYKTFWLALTNFRLWEGALMMKIKIFLIAWLASAVAACSSLPNVGSGELLGSLNDDAVGLNERYTDANASVIALNVLRSRDRVLRSYTSMSGLTATPSGTTTGTLELVPLGLGNPATPFGESGATAERAVGSELEYSVNPFAESDGPIGLFRPASTDTFESFWDRGWPGDVLIPLFVHSFRKDGSKEDTAFWSDATETDIHDCWKDLLDCFDTKECSINFHKDTTVEALKLGKKVEVLPLCRPGGTDQCCTLFTPDWVDDFAPGATSLSHSFSAIEKASDKEIRIIDGMPMICKGPETSNIISYGKGEARTYLTDVEFRSFDGMIYFLGETIRRHRTERTDMLVPLKPTCASKASPEFFSLLPETEARNSERNFSLTVSYRGEDYFAIPYSSDTTSIDEYECLSDRTGLVMSILMQLYLLNQSPEFLKAPNNSIDP